MTGDTQVPAEGRLVQLLQHFGIDRAHVAARLPSDWSGLATAHPAMMASLTLVCPGEFPHPLRQPPTLPCLVFTGDQGTPAEAVGRMAEVMPQASIVTLRQYFAHPRSDLCVERGEEITTALLAFLEKCEQDQRMPTVALAQGDGEMAGITYRVKGSGPPLLLLPLGLAASQWEPLLDRLSTRYCTILLGGPFLGSVVSLEARGHAAGYLGVVRSLIEAARIQPEELVLDVGCGTGVLDRWLVHRTDGSNHIIATDIHRSLLREARALARLEGLEGSITFQLGNAEALPFHDDTFDVALSSTVMELLDADQMLREMVRVTKPGGRVGVVVRAVDLPSVVNAELPPTLKTKSEALPNGVAGERGCADASLYRRFRRAELEAVYMMPHWATYQEADHLHSALERITTVLRPTELQEWQTGVDKAMADGTFFIAVPFHCAVGTKPSTPP
jgi:SAM-dependent methyltransferase